MDAADCPILDGTPAGVPFIIFAKAGLRALLEFYATNDDGTQGDPLDFTGWTNFKLVATNPADAEDEYFTLTQSSGLDVNGNGITVTIARATLDGYFEDWQRANYYLVGDDATGTTIPLTAGPFILTLNPVTQLGQGAC